jgi:hypothetical protein
VEIGMTIATMAAISTAVTGDKPADCRSTLQ